MNNSCPTGSHPSSTPTSRSDRPPASDAQQADGPSRGHRRFVVSPAKRKTATSPANSGGSTPAPTVWPEIGIWSFSFMRQTPSWMRKLSGACRMRSCLLSCCLRSSSGRLGWSRANDVTDHPRTIRRCLRVWGDVEQERHPLIGANALQRHAAPFWGWRFSCHVLSRYWAIETHLSRSQQLRTVTNLRTAARSGGAPAHRRLARRDGGAGGRLRQPQGGPAPLSISADATPRQDAQA